MAHAMSILQNVISGSIETLQTLRSLEAPLQRAAEMVGGALRDGKKLLCCGNGGSGADAAHFATEFLCRFMGDRRPYPALCLASEGSLLTAIGNDYQFEEIFARQVWGLAVPGDVLAVFTTSGNSRNVVRALEEAKRVGIQSIAFLGRDGGVTKGLATVELLVSGNVTARVQEAHKVLLHALCEMVEEMVSKL